MTSYRLSPEAHAASMRCLSSMSASLTARKQHLMDVGTLTTDKELEFAQDQAYLEVAREQVAHLASGNATEADERRFTNMAMVKVSEWAERLATLQKTRELLEGLVAFNELGTDGELVTVN